MTGHAASPRMEISGEGLTPGAGTVLAGMAQDERGRPRLALDDEHRILALLATAYARPVEACVAAKLRRACERWTEGEKALAHIHFAHAGVPPCGPDQALRLFVADELIEAGVTPETLLKAQGFDPASLALSKYSADQPRVPAGSGRESGRWTPDSNPLVNSPHSCPAHRSRKHFGKFKQNRTVCVRSRQPVPAPAPFATYQKDN